MTEENVRYLQIIVGERGNAVGYFFSLLTGCFVHVAKHKDILGKYCFESFYLTFL